MTVLSRRTRLAAAAAGVTLSLVLATVVVAQPSTAQPSQAESVEAQSAQVVAPVPQLRWRKCDNIKRTLCTLAEVPLDYDDPTGPTIRIALAKKPARDQAARLGTLFVNPGGPGGPARGFAPFAARLLGRTVENRYDVIGIDPRGVGRSFPIRCRVGGSVRVPFTDWLFPRTKAEARKTWKQGRVANRVCRQGGNEIVGHMTTADTARDMDLIRQAVGEPQLDYYGISYGSYLGATYAALFPDRVGRFVVDAVLDPVAWATGADGPARLPFTTRLNSSRGAYEALTSGLAECDRLGPRRCLFAGQALATWRDLVREAKAGTLTFDGEPVNYSLLVAVTLGLLYDSDYSFLAAVLRSLRDESRGVSRSRETTRALSGLDLDDLRRRAAEVMAAPYTAPAARGVTIEDPFLGVGCGDTDNPTGRETWYKAGRAQDVRTPWYGSLWTWFSAPCARWPSAFKEDRYAGDFVTTTARPILVVGNTFDPATPVQGARRFTTLFSGSRFLLLEGWGHGALGNACVTSAFNDYYATGALPPEGATCEPDRRLFRRFGAGLR